jgi:tRNA(Arg) A34 adenosine deaminase TadA
MEEAAGEATLAVENAHGGPFGAVVVRNGEVIWRGHNHVVTNNDPTAHAEVIAIREACRVLDTFDLTGCDLYTTCEPCPMCYAAAWWSRITTIYYGSDRHDAAAIGFDDAAIYDDLEGGERSLEMIQTEREICLRPMNAWRDDPHRVKY